MEKGVPWRIFRRVSAVSWNLHCSSGILFLIPAFPREHPWQTCPDSSCPHQQRSIFGRKLGYRTLCESLYFCSRTCMGGPLFELRFPTTEIDHWSQRYQYEGDTVIEQNIAPLAKQVCFLTTEQFLALCHWKSPRTAPRCARNSSDFIKDVTQVALSTADERLKIEILTLLDGVSWPTASVILHFCDRNPYPILDFRALWSLNVRQPSRYAFPIWQDYTTFVRSLATKSGRTMRVVDRALWQYSKEHQH